jgi:hypothetical protein
MIRDIPYHILQTHHSAQNFQLIKGTIHLKLRCRDNNHTHILTDEYIFGK